LDVHQAVSHVGEHAVDVEHCHTHSRKPRVEGGGGATPPTGTLWWASISFLPDIMSIIGG
jgi:hypothetical protein